MAHQQSASLSKYLRLFAERHELLECQLQDNRYVIHCEKPHLLATSERSYRSGRTLDNSRLCLSAGSIQFAATGAASTAAAAATTTAVLYAAAARELRRSVQEGYNSVVRKQQNIATTQQQLLQHWRLS
eukprot:15681-Heterococcus_DN1.PRE.2